MLYDLSPEISPRLPVWPGDTAFSARWTWSLAAGASVNVSALESTPHLGSHVDAPLHTEAGGAAIADLPLEPFVGPCRVVRVPAVDTVEPEHLPAEALAGCRRLLLATRSIADRSRFPERFSALSAELAHLLARQGVILVGLDTPSVDPPASKTLEAHHALAAGGVAILEGLILDDVPPGDYELLALPLRFAGLDASPVRAILRTPATASPRSPRGATMR